MLDLEFPSFLAAEDERRYNEEMEVFRSQNPGWLEWHEKHTQRAKEERSADAALRPKVGSKAAVPKKPSFKKPKPPLTPYMAYVQAQIEKKLESDPDLESGVDWKVGPLPFCQKEERVPGLVTSLS
jgi:hypothetical protein